jgi:hypothetical protein
VFALLHLFCCTACDQLLVYHAHSLWLTAGFSYAQLCDYLQLAIFACSSTDAFHLNSAHVIDTVAGYWNVQLAYTLLLKIKEKRIPSYVINL